MRSKWSGFALFRRRLCMMGMCSLSMSRRFRWRLIGCLGIVWKLIFRRMWWRGSVVRMNLGFKRSLGFVKVLNVNRFWKEGVWRWRGKKIFLWRWGLLMLSFRVIIWSLFRLLWGNLFQILLSMIVLLRGNWGFRWRVILRNRIWFLRLLLSCLRRLLFLRWEGLD